MISVCLYGCNENVTRSLTQAFKNRSQGTFRVSEANISQLSVIDFEGLGGMEPFLELERRIRTPFVVMADQTFAHSGYHVAKPMRYSALVEALNKAFDGLTSHTLRVVRDHGADESESDGAARPAADSVRETVELSDFLVGFLIAQMDRHRRAKKSTFHVDLGKGRWLHVDLNLGGVFSNVDRKILDQLAIGNVQQLGLKASDAAKDFEPDDAAFSSELDAYLYRLTQLISRRKLVAGYDTQTAYQLATYPNFIAQIRDDRQLALLSYWAQSPSSLNELASRFALELDTLMPLFNACVACGVVSRGQSANTTGADKPNPVKNVLRMILARFAAAA